MSVLGCKAHLFKPMTFAHLSCLRPVEGNVYLNFATIRNLYTPIGIAPTKKILQPYLITSLPELVVILQQTGVQNSAELQFVVIASVLEAFLLHPL
mmetsp:Transcript_30179/g.42761  ORF Transcript_30179/g.42761 Transcript_30179/m.42761 type:complete len:96 (+) Transcript_30179:105-392(+)